MFIGVSMKFLIFCFCFISAFAVEPSAELIFRANQTKEDKELNLFLSNFPYHDYEICHVQDSGTFYVDDTADVIKGCLYRGLPWESGIAKLIERFIKPGTIALDIGAHIGTHTVKMSQAVGPKGLVIAFEPQKKIFRELLHNLALNDCSHNTIVLRNAVGDCEKSIEMSKATVNNEGGTAIGKGGDPVYMITLDSLNLSDVSFIKMDVESYELNLLRGARETLIRNKPVIILEILGGVDLNTCQGAYREHYKAVIAYLNELGYSVERIQHCDFIAFPDASTKAPYRNSFFRAKAMTWPKER